jgi:cell division protein FtsW (lipid II flippase)
MRPMNKRLVFTGVFLIALAIVFFLFFLSIASKSNDPVKLLRTAGTVSGVLVGIGVALLVSGRPRKAA